MYHSCNKFLTNYCQYTIVGYMLSEIPNSWYYVNMLYLCLLNKYVILLIMILYPIPFLHAKARKVHIKL